MKLRHKLKIIKKLIVNQLIFKNLGLARDIDALGILTQVKKGEDARNKPKTALVKQ